MLEDSQSASSQGLGQRVAVVAYISLLKDIWPTPQFGLKIREVFGIGFAPRESL